jgi:hypothetical protein
MCAGTNSFFVPACQSVFNVFHPSLQNGLWTDNRYQHKKTATVRHRMINGPGLPLNRLREAPDSVMTEFNPTYEFGGETYTIQDLKDIPRDHLRLVK